MKGIIYVPDIVTAIGIAKRFEEKGYSFIVCEKFESLLNNIWDFAPDLIIVHCHVFDTEVIGRIQIKDRFEEIRKLIKAIRERLENTFVVLSYNILIDADYATEHLFNNDFDDLFAEIIDKRKLDLIARLVVERQEKKKL